MVDSGSVACQLDAVIPGLTRWHSGKESTCQCRVGFLGWEDPLEEGMATHSSILAWRIPRTEVWQARVRLESDMTKLT